MHVWTIVAGQTCATASASPLSPSQTRMQQSFVPRFLISVSTCSQYLALLPAVAGPQTEDVAFAVYRDRQRDVDGSVGDLPIADLDVVRWARSAVSALRPVRFSGPPPEPDVRLDRIRLSTSPVKALGLRIVQMPGQGEGIAVPR